MVDRFSKKMLFQIEDLKMKGQSINQIAKKLNISTIDVKNGLNKIFEDEMKAEH
jgi:DNA-binding NarL/FixJ family response regulator